MPNSRTLTATWPLAEEERRGRGAVVERDAPGRPPSASCACGPRESDRARVGARCRRPVHRVFAAGGLRRARRRRRRPRCSARHQHRRGPARSRREFREVRRSRRCARAGVEPGDRILEIDGATAAGLTCRRSQTIVLSFFRFVASLRLVLLGHQQGHRVSHQQAGEPLGSR